ncbi:NADH-quinone oxidoreductase subunit H [Chondromyces apiculatus]|uniref:PDZ domain-containing protein n=1 Tax=Chondromyces apiculatus DSM 436 TaxID=1192034 RepID=A0A017TCV3_9BACT|nr:NADH-quinone oxidoreductase subunit H [Chondromyces apiculatus]EYF06461.1 Hypothetical protein CAP_1991 [Chondromyces apiculatus DSM 436]
MTTRCAFAFAFAFARLALVLAALLGVVGCSGDLAPDLLNVVDVVPRLVDAGDRVEILGTNLPTGERREATVVFEGELRRPGQAPLTGQRVEIDRAQLASDRVVVPFTEDLQRRFCGQGDEAVHTTFAGSVTVRVASVGPGALEVKGTVEAVTLDFVPPPPRRAIAEARAREGARALVFLGITASSDTPPAGGIAVTEVRPNSPASGAGIEPGDRIVSFEGVQLLTADDLIPSGQDRLPEITTQRGDGPLTRRTIAVDGFKPSGSSDLLGAGILLGTLAGILLVFVSPTARLLAWLERRITARLRAGTTTPAGVKQFPDALVAAVRALFRDDLPPGKDDGGGFRLAPYLVLIGVSATFAVMPFGQYLLATDLDIGVLFVIALTALVMIGLLTGGGAAKRWTPIAGLRSALQILSYQLPAAVAVCCVVMMTGSLRIEDILDAQAGTGGSPVETGGWPWYWFVFRSPVTFALFALYFTATLAEGSRVQATMPEAEGPVANAPAAQPSQRAPRAHHAPHPPHPPQSPAPTPATVNALQAPQAPLGMRQTLFIFAEWANVLIMCGVASALFLGGWQIPGVAAASLEAKLGLQILGALLFLLKSWLLILGVVWLRWVLPRVRVDQMTTLCWRLFVPLTLAAALLTGLWMVVQLPQAAQMVTSVVTFALASFVLVHLIRRVNESVRATRTPLHLNPFL